MEIDFLGLNSPKYKIEQENSKDAFKDSANAGDEISLSLSTSSSLACKSETFDFCEKKTWEFPCDQMILSCSSSSNSTLSSLAYYKQDSAPKIQPSLVLVPRPVFHPVSTTGFLYDLNDKSTNLRNISELPAETASLTILYSGCANVFNQTLPEKANNTIYMAGNASTGPSSDSRKCTKGYTPTVAMARRATLARFLKKRLHRMNQARTSHLMGKSLNATHSEVSNKSKNNSIIRS